MKKNQILEGVTFTNREMRAIANMLLGTEGINVDPIINDLYSDLDEGQKEIFRCKMALMLKGQLPEFQEYVGFRRVGSSRILKVRVFGESSLLGLLRMEIMEVYKRQEKDGSESWVLDKDDYSIGEKMQEHIDFSIHKSLEDAITNW